jgi:uncharacterized protein
MTSQIYDTDKRKLLSAVCHGSLFFSPLFLSVGVPITLYYLSDDPIVKENAKESINFHFNVWAYTLIIGFISWFWWTIILLPVIWILGIFLLFLTWVLPIFAILSCLNNEDQSYRYPFIVRLL